MVVLVVYVYEKEGDMVSVIIIDIMKFTVFLSCVCACVWRIKSKIDFSE